MLALPLGVAIGRVSAEAEFAPGHIADASTAEYLFVKYTALTDRGEAVIVNTDHEAEPLTLDAGVGWALASALACARPMRRPTNTAG